MGKGKLQMTIFPEVLGCYFKLAALGSRSRLTNNRNWSRKNYAAPVPALGYCTFVTLFKVK